MCIQLVRDFPQTKLDGKINSPFLLNEHSDPNFFQVFAKNSLIKNIFEEEFDSRTCFCFCKTVPHWVYFEQGEEI